jgi:hypothetical protein
MSTQKQWARRSQSANNFDLILANPQDLNSERIKELLDRIQGETHRGLSLSARADKEFRRWSTHPDTPLKSEAYVLLSNWFLTQSGDRHSMVASHCEALWDELFLCRPAKRLSSPEPGRNHVMVPAEFEDFWKTVLKAQGEEEQLSETAGANAQANITPFQPVTYPTVRLALTPSEVSEGSTNGESAGKPLTIAEAKAALARTFGVSPDKVEITIRG